MFNRQNTTKFWIEHIRNQNELNLTSRLGQKDQVIKNIYNSFNLFSTYDFSSTPNLRLKNDVERKDHGAILNLCFKPDDGRLLLAGTEENALLLFDALSHRNLIDRIDNAHDQSVNYIKFLDSNLFATCSNDGKIKLFDLRNLRLPALQTLRGHSHFVKNLEYDPNLRYLLSSGFDGNVNMWNLFGGSSNSTNDEQLDDGFIREESSQDGSSSPPYKKVLNLSCLMRMRLTYDHSKMIISTVEGYLMVVHDLNLNTLQEDLSEFRSDLYRLMQKKHSVGIDFGSWRNSRFTASRNRVELISDFPNEEAHLIGALDVHPFNWTILSRNLSRDENTEYTVVHNIQDYERPNEMMCIEPKRDNIYYPHYKFRNRRGNSNADDQPTADQMNNETLSNNPNDLHNSPLIIISARTSFERAQATLLNPRTSYRLIDPGQSPPPKIYCNLNRMTHYLEELKSYKLFPKEPHFSKCGRFIASPFGFGFRLLSFNTACTELTDDQMLCGSNSNSSNNNDSTDQPRKLNELKRFTNHSNLVTTVNFSPAHHLLASGCLSGQINFYQPVL